MPAPPSRPFPTRKCIRTVSAISRTSFTAKAYAGEDINYKEASDDEKTVLFELYCKLVNYFGPSVGFELSVVCYPADLEEYRKILAIPAQGDSSM